MIYIFFILKLIACYFIASNFPTWARKPIKWVKDLYEIRRLKPFDCSPCFGFWLTLVVISIHFNLFIGVVIAFAMYYRLRNDEIKKLYE